MIKSASRAEGPMPEDIVELLNGQTAKVSDEKEPIWDPAHWVYMVVDHNGDTRYVRRSKKHDSGKTKGWIETEVRGLKSGPSEPRQLGFRMNPRRTAMRTRELVEPEDEEIMISENQREAYYIGRLIARADEWDELMEAISEWMNSNKYWPSVWYNDDHGGWHDVSNEIPHSRSEHGISARANPRYRFRPGDRAIGVGGSGLSPQADEHVTVVRKVPWRTIEGAYRDPGPRAVYYRGEDGKIGYTFPQYLRLETGQSAIERKLEHPTERLGREFRHLPEQPIEDPQLPGAMGNPRRKSFDEATALLGYAIADRLLSEKDPEGRISTEDREWFGDWAHGRLEELFNRDPKWNRKLRGTRGREHAYMWIGHWMDAFISRGPETFRRGENERKHRIEMKGLGRNIQGARRNPPDMEFQPMDTGGNCTALYAEHGNFHVLVTDYDDPVIPVAGKRFIVGLYDTNDEILLTKEFENFNQEDLSVKVSEMINSFRRSSMEARKNPIAHGRLRRPNPTRAELVRWLAAELTNDEASSDEEMEGHLVSEGGVSPSIAKDLVHLRGNALRGREVLGDVKRILGGARGNPVVHGRLRRPVTEEDADKMAHRLRLRNVPMDEFRRGLNEELEHRDVTRGNALNTGRIAAAHLREDPKYYTKLERAMRKNPGKNPADQYGKPVPDDLVILPDPNYIAEEDIQTVMNARWYDVDGLLVASYAEIKGLSEDDPLDAGINLSKPDIEIDYVADVLHRWSPEDGFYHV